MKEFIKENHKIALVFLAIIILYFYGSNKMPLLNRTDSRYAEIAREMVVTGDYLIPKLMGTPHLHKPPLSYWFMALGMKIFGVNEFGVRFFLTVFAILSLLLIYLIAKELFNSKKALWALILSAISPGIFFTSRVLATDIFLLFFELSAFYFYLKFKKQKKELWICLFWLSLGLGFMTKGPVAIVIPLLILFVTSLFNRDFSDFKPFFKSKFLIFFSIIAFPWYLYLIFSDEKILKYFVIDQLYARIAGIKGTKIGHPKPFYYYFEILPVLILPYYIPFVIVLIKKIKNGFSKTELFLIVWFSLPLVFFSLILTKLPTYILFSIPPAAMITADWLEETKSKLKCLWLTSGFLPFLFLLNDKLFSLSPVIMREIMEFTIIISVMVVTLIIIKFVKKNCFKTVFLVAWVIVYFLIVNLFISYPQILKSNKKLALITKNIGYKNIKTVCFRQYAFQLPFYTKEIPYYCDIKLEKEIAPFRKLISCKDLKTNWNNHNFMVLISKKDLIDFVNIVNDFFILAHDGKQYVVSNKPLWGIKIKWKKGIQTHNPVNLNQLLKNIKIPFKTAYQKAYATVGRGYTLHDAELAILNNRLYYEFEFIKGKEFKEIHIDAFNGKIITNEVFADKPEFTDKQLSKLTAISKKQARKTTLTLIKGKIREEEIEIENGVLCYAFHIQQHNHEYEVLINVSNGLPFKVSLEK